MKSLVFSLIVLILFSCTNRSSNNPQKEETPKALEENSGDGSFEFSKSYRGGNLVEEIYQELVGKNDSLKQLEKEIEDVKELKSDSTRDFNNYNSKNDNYYTSANSLINGIQDSLIRQRMKFLIEASSSSYSKKINQQKSLINNINSKEIALSDLHLVLKLAKTLTIIEKYQNNNLPDTKPLEEIIRKFEKTIKKTDSQAKIK